jgi:hypothetical protein
MSPTNDQVSKDNDMEPTHDEGDLYDEDSGEFLGNVAPVDKSLPAQLSYFHAGYWYIFKPDSRYKQQDLDEEQEPAKVVTLREELSGTELAERAGEIKKLEPTEDSPLKKHFSDPNKDITLP